MKNPKFKYFEELESTNTYAMKNLSVLSDMDIIVASKQTNGRGQFERKWISDKQNNVYLSIVLKPSCALEKLPLVNFSQYTSVVICRILKEYGVSAGIKYPNDVLVQGEKIAGILCESSICGTVLKGLVIGIGINLNLEQGDVKKVDQPATSLNLLIKKPVDRNLFIDKLICEFLKNYEPFLQQGFEFIKQEYALLDISSDKSFI